MTVPLRELRVELRCSRRLSLEQLQDALPLALRPMRIFAKTLTGRTIEIHTAEGWTVGQLKFRIQLVEGIPPDQQRLIFAGTQLQDEETMESYNIRTDSVLHLILRLRGNGDMLSNHIAFTVPANREVEVDTREPLIVSFDRRCYLQGAQIRCWDEETLTELKGHVSKDIFTSTLIWKPELQLSPRSAFVARVYYPNPEDRFRLEIPETGFLWGFTTAENPKLTLHVGYFDIQAGGEDYHFPPMKLDLEVAPGSLLELVGFVRGAIRRKVEAWGVSFDLQCCGAPLEDDEDVACLRHFDVVLVTNLRATRKRALAEDSAERL